MSGSPAHGSSFILPQQISYAAARAGHDSDPHAVPLAPSRGGRPGTPARRPDTPARHTDTPARHPDWISSLPLRLAAGDPAAAARHATRLVEALAPAVDAYLAASEPAQAKLDALAAAQRGAESTKDLVAKLGRARPLGERSLGTPDPGATSLVMVLEELAGRF